jgi:hypothetical protein
MAMSCCFVVERERATFRRSHGVQPEMMQPIQDTGGVFWTMSAPGYRSMASIGCSSGWAAARGSARVRANRDQDRVEQRGGREVYGQHRAIQGEIVGSNTWAGIEYIYRGRVGCVVTKYHKRVCVDWRRQGHSSVFAERVGRARIAIHHRRTVQRRVGWRSQGRVEGGAFVLS